MSQSSRSSTSSSASSARSSPRPAWTTSLAPFGAAATWSATRRAAAPVQKRPSRQSQYRPRAAGSWPERSRGDQPGARPMQTALTDAIRAAQDELRIEIASSPEQLREAQRLRFRVYCQERGFEPGKDGLE